MGIKTNLDERGRITLPKIIRDKFGLKNGDELIVDESDGNLVIKINKTNFRRIKANVNWEKIGFFKSGEATFED